MADCHPLGENCDGQASREERAMINLGSDEDGVEFVPIELDPDGKGITALRELRESFDTIAPAIDTPLITEIADRMAEDGYDPDVLIHGTPGHIIRVPAAEDVQRGDAVEIGADGMARRADDGHIVGVAIGGNRIRLLPDLDRVATHMTSGMHMSMNRGYYGSMAYQASIIGGPGRGFPRAGGPARYQYNERFPKEVIDKAMALLAKFMNVDQYKAFMEGSLIELQNKAEDHRIMFNRNGKFSILKGPRGAGITMTSGNIGSYKYPLGDEIAVFLDWFNHRTLELIDRWRCGTYTIKDGDLR